MNGLLSFAVANARAEFSSRAVAERNEAILTTHVREWLGGDAPEPPKFWTCSTCGRKAFLDSVTPSGLAVFVCAEGHATTKRVDR